MSQCASPGVNWDLLIGSTTFGSISLIANIGLLWLVTATTPPILFTVNNKLRGGVVCLQLNRHGHFGNNKIGGSHNSALEERLLAEDFDEVSSIQTSRAPRAP